MIWEQGGKQDLPDIINFLLPLEHTCVSLTSKFNNKGRPLWPEENPRVAVLKENASIEGVFYISKRGLALPCFTRQALTYLSNHSLPFVFRKPIKKIHTCIGTEEAVEIVERHKKQKRNHVRYRLLIQDKPKKVQSRYDSRIEICTAGPEHCDMLFSLHAGYEKEEVLLSPDKFNERFQRILFHNKLTNQLFFYALHDGKPVGTAATNARGFSWEQLGSIFTVQEMRGKGIATALVSALCRELHKSGKNNCLFVKTENLPALALYKKLGFSGSAPYRISYFV